MFAILGYVGWAVLAGVAALKVVAPKTKTHTDDKVLDALEKINTALPVVTAFAKSALNKNGK